MSTALALPAAAGWRPSGRRRVLAAALTAVVAAAVLAFLVTHRDAPAQAAQGLRHASWPWVLVSVAAVAAGYVGAATALSAAAGGAVSVRRATVVEVAGVFCNRLGPGGLGGGLLRARVLTCAGLPLARALAVIAAIGVAGALAQAMGITIVMVAVPTATVSPPTTPLAIMAATVPAAAGIGWFLRRRIPRGWAAGARELGRHLRDLARTPSALLRVLAGPAVSAAACGVAFWAAAHAVGVDLGAGTAMLVYLAGTLLAAAAPVPGGVGPAELALTAGLIGAGTASGPALAAVLTFRLASFWLPTALGAVALVGLRRSGLTSYAPPAVTTASVANPSTSPRKTPQ